MEILQIDFNYCNADKELKKLNEEKLKLFIYLCDAYLKNASEFPLKFFPIKFIKINGYKSMPEKLKEEFKNILKSCRKIGFSYEINEIKEQSITDFYLNH